MYSPNYPELFRLFLEHTPAAVAMLDRDMRYIGTSKRWLKDYGLSEKSLIGYSHYEIFPETPASWKDACKRCLAGAVSSGSAEKLVRSNGLIDWVNWECRPWYDLKGDVGGVFILTEVITREIEAKEALRQSEERFNKLANKVPGMIFQFFIKPDGSMAIPYVSPGCKQLLELEPENLQQNPMLFYRPIHPDDRPTLKDSLMVSADTLLPWLWEGRVITRSGRQKWVRAVSRPELQKSGGIVWDGLMIDISDRVSVEESLKQYQEKLEDLVAGRTRELAETNAKLQAEIAEREQASLLLAEQKHTLRSILDNAPIWIWMLDRKERVQFINKTFCEKIGVPESRFLEVEHYSEIFGIEASASSIASDKACWKKDTPHQSEESFLFVDGQVHTLEILRTKVKDAQNNVVGLLGLAVDISERKQSEARYQELVRREQLVNRLASQVRKSLDLDTVLETATQEIKELLQIDRCSFSWLDGDTLAPYWSTIKEAKKSGFTSLLGSHSSDKIGEISQIFFKQEFQPEILQIDDVSLYEEPIHRRFLETLGIKSEIILPIKTLSGRIGAIICTHSLSTRPWAKEEVELLQSVVDQLAIAINQAELYTQANQAAVTARNQTRKLELAFQELKATQAQLVQSEKMSSLGQLVAGVAHEVNNPVNFIYANLVHAGNYTNDLLDLLKHYQQAYPQATPDIIEEIDAIDLDFLLTDLPQLMNSMKVGAERIRGIVQSLRVFSRLDEADMKTVNIHDGIDSTLMILQHRLKPKPEYPEIQLIKQYGDLPLVVCYAGQLNQVFMNLIANAIDALEEALVKQTISNPIISISTGIISNNRVAIRVADNGIGMTPEVQKNLFDPFFTTKPVGEGTGLGLSISYQIVVEKHRGQLYCNSQLGKGTEFIIEIPVEQPNNT